MFFVREMVGSVFAAGDFKPNAKKEIPINILGLFAATRPPFGTQLWFAGVIELVAGLAVMLGIGTRLAAFVASGEMAVAYFQVHWKFQIGERFFPIVNNGELAVLYGFLFLYIALKGPGKWSLAKRS